MSDVIFIGVAWPYANNSLHVGHIAGSILAPDIFARYHRLRGNRVLMVSGSDEHGTPITVRAEREGVSPKEIADRYHAEHVRDLEGLGISFDLFFRTSHPNHISTVQDFFRVLLDKGMVYPRKMTAYHCPECGRFLPDRYVEGVCPHCGAEGARGDQCDACGRTLDPGELREPRCRLCGAAPELRDTEHFFFRLSAFQERLERYVSEMTHWRPSVKNFTMQWIKEGLRDRAITRDLTWGVPIPMEGYEDKRIYVWFEAVIGYYSTSIEWGRRTGEDWKVFWSQEAKHYYFLGKDNIPFHTIIWPAMLMAHGGLQLPYDVPANEYLTMKGRKISKSRGNIIPISYCLERMDPDQIRYYLTSVMPENHDESFSLEDLVRRNNHELVNTLGNFVHRVLSFTAKHFGEVPEHTDDGWEAEAASAVEKAYTHVSGMIERCSFKSALKGLMDLAHFGNTFIDQLSPWDLIKTDRDRCGAAMRACLRVVKAMAVLSHPFMPGASERMWHMLGYSEPIRSWDDGLAPPEAGRRLRDVRPLFRKLDMSLFEEPGFPLNLRVGEILEVRDHPNADRLYLMRVSFGDHEKQAVAGLKGHYSPEELTGLRAVFITNLRPAKMRGEKSEVMVLAAEKDGVVSILCAPWAEPGEPVLPEGAEAEYSREVKFDGFLKEGLKVENGRAAWRGMVLQASSRPVELTRKVADGAGIH